MQINQSCEDCLLRKEQQRANEIENKELALKYMKKVKKILSERTKTSTAPYIKYLFDKEYDRMFGHDTSLTQLKAKYNDLVLCMEDEIEKAVNASDDPLATALIYARIGNYIDFGAQVNVTPEEFLEMLNKKSTEGLPEETYRLFIEKCSSAKKFLLLCDNCGEIVIDKVFLRVLKKRFPGLTTYAMVRGFETLNDATAEDAAYCGLDKEAIIVPSGNGIAGTVLEMLSPEALDILSTADVILSKGQGNFECLSPYNYDVFFSFLCKCELFTERFNVPKFTGIFICTGE